MPHGSQSLLGTPRRRRSRRRQPEEPALSAGAEEQPHHDVPVDDQTGTGEIPEIPNPGEQNAAGDTVAPPSSQAQPVQARRAPVSSRLGPQAHQATPEGRVEDLTVDWECELFEPDVVQRSAPVTRRPSPVIRPSLVARLSLVIRPNSAAPPPPPLPGIEELLRNYLTTASGREFLNQYTRVHGASHFGPGGPDLRHHLQQIRGQTQGILQPNSHVVQPNYAAAPPHGAPPQGHLAGGAQIFDAISRIISPLSEDILNTPMPFGYKVPNIKPYNGIGNPSNFLSQFKYSMLNQNLGSVHMCKLFPELLIDNVREWFDSLQAGSIRSYADLMNVFARSFSQRAEVRHTLAHLLTVKQNRGESLQDFMTRFDRECLQTRCTNDLLIISAFQNAISSDLLYKEILAKEPQTTTELWAIADKFTKIDEATRRRREVDRGETSKKKEDAHRKSMTERIQRGPLESRLGPRQNTTQP